MCGTRFSSFPIVDEFLSENIVGVSRKPRKLDSTLGLLPVPGICGARQQRTQSVNRVDRDLASVTGPLAKSHGSIIHAHMCE